MTRLLLAPIAVLALFAGVLPLAAGGVAGWQGLAKGLLDPAIGPALARVLHRAVIAALAAPLCAVPLGFAGALAVAPAARWVRGLIYALAVLLLIAPAPGFDATGLADLTRPAALVAFACAIARGAALALLILTPSLHALPAGLKRAAMQCGAGPLRAWWDAVVVPLSVPLCGAVVAAAISTVVEGPAAAVLAPHLNLARAWVAPACLLMMAASIAALSLLLRRPAV